MLHHFATLGSAIRTMGAFRGSIAYIERALALSTRRASITELRLRDDDLPIYVRLAKSDWYALTQVFFKDEYDPKSSSHDSAMNRLYTETLAKGKTPCIIDCGANIGMASVWYSRTYPKAKIISVEPEPENFSVLLKNAASRPQIHPINAAISDRSGFVELQNTQDNDAWAWETRESQSGGVKTVTICDLLASDESLVPFILKIDIEGFEVELFRSNTEWVEQTPLVVFESHDHGYSWRGTAHAILSVLTKDTRDYIQHGENTFAFSHALLKQL
ncbi:FkbM family methyltransferase [Bradyrhizobium yuanmingense]|uniref:FkbM family methyltransferase n=1 Tax=Bradyrhizobium yuanmingense TaxID=108015 RepID=UPI0023B95EC0|nr:FkbM family methyltransferase [Bradyrhizobium yuanmingense]MDF0578898.1 FkbM family methyltransferase [Bradyrhizobium yuanmingense]